MPMAINEWSCRGSPSIYKINTSLDMRRQLFGAVNDSDQFAN